MEKILGGLVLVNGTDIWSTYGVFLVEDKRGGMGDYVAGLLLVVLSRPNVICILILLFP